MRSALRYGEVSDVRIGRSIYGMVIAVPSGSEHGGVDAQVTDVRATLANPVIAKNYRYEVISRKRFHHA